MTDFYNKIVEWYKDGGGCGYSIACHTSTEFDNYKKDILTYLENHCGADIEATISMDKMKLSRIGKEYGSIDIVKRQPDTEISRDSMSPSRRMETLRERRDVIRGRRAQMGIIDDYHEHSADDINNVILPLLNVPPLTEDQVNHLVEATNNARLYH